MYTHILETLPIPLPIKKVLMVKLQPLFPDSLSKYFLQVQEVQQRSQSPPGRAVGGVRGRRHPWWLTLQEAVGLPPLAPLSPRSLGSSRRGARGAGTPWVEGSSSPHLSAAGSQKKGHLRLPTAPCKRTHRQQPPAGTGQGVPWMVVCHHLCSLEAPTETRVTYQPGSQVSDLSIFEHVQCQIQAPTAFQVYTGTEQGFSFFPLPFTRT